MEKNVIIDESGEFAYLPFFGTLLNMSQKPSKSPATPVEKDNSSNEYIEWGDNNDYPDTVEEKIRENSLIPSVLFFKASHIAASEINYGISNGFDKHNNAIYKRIEHEEIEEFFTLNNKQLFIDDLLRNLITFHIAFADLYQNKEKTRIVAVSAHDSGDIRFSRQNPKTGHKDYVYIDANWPDGSTKTWQKVRNIDPYWDVQGQLKNLPDTRFVYPVFFNFTRRKYYPFTPWHSIINSYWLDVAKKIPRFKAHLMDNQMTVSYVIHIPRDWWAWAFPDFEKKTEADKKTIRNQVAQQFSESLSGIKAAGKVLMMDFKGDPSSYNKFTKWEIQPMKNDIKEGAYIEDSQEASDHILFALAFDGTLIGKTPGKSIGAGSGSDKRLADEIFFKNNRAYILKVIEVLQLITDFNQWKTKSGQRIRWFHSETISTTLNNINPEDRP
jgi:hypothetical protein